VKTQAKPGQRYFWPEGCVVRVEANRPRFKRLPDGMSAEDWELPIGILLQLYPLQQAFEEATANLRRVNRHFRRLVNR
jgi:hypothetical protein